MVKLKSGRKNIVQKSGWKSLENWIISLNYWKRGVNQIFRRPLKLVFGLGLLKNCENAAKDRNENLTESSPKWRIFISEDVYYLGSHLIYIKFKGKYFTYFKNFTFLLEINYFYTCKNSSKIEKWTWTAEILITKGFR